VTPANKPSNKIKKVDIQDEKQLLHKITTHLNLKSNDELYALTASQVSFPTAFITHQQKFKDKGGDALLKQYKHPYKMLSTLLPEYQWLPWKFETTPRYFWDDTENHSKFLTWAANELNIKELSDWYKVTRNVKIFVTINSV
jgi:hypothetical protein